MTDQEALNLKEGDAVIHESQTNTGSAFFDQGCYLNVWRVETSDNFLRNNGNRPPQGWDVMVWLENGKWLAPEFLRKIIVPAVGDKIKTICELQSGSNIIPAGSRLEVRLINKAGVSAVDSERFLHTIRHGDFEVL